jgi:hypothetical protein
MTQLRLPIPEIDPSVQLQAARRLDRIVKHNRQSFETRDYAKRRAAALKHTRAQVADC